MGLPGARAVAFSSRRKFSLPHTPLRFFLISLLLALLLRHLRSRRNAPSAPAPAFASVSASVGAPAERLSPRQQADPARVVSVTRERDRRARIWATCNGDATCCAARFSPRSRPHVVMRAEIRTVDKHHLRWPMALRAHIPGERDAVSESISFYRSWKKAKTRRVLKALGRSSAAAGTLVDIGANIGWLTLAAAYAGNRVVAVEPFAENIALLAHSLCIAPADVRARVTLLSTGLGARDNVKCEMWTKAEDLRGNAHAVCDKAATATRMAASGYKRIDEVTLRRFDSLVEEADLTFAVDKKVVVKIDVQGFEYQAMQGAKEFLDIVQPWRIFADYVPRMMQWTALVGESPNSALSSPRDFLAFMRKKGYSNSIVSQGKPDKIWGQVYEAAFKRIF